MQLMFSPASPFVRKVRVAAIEAGLAERIELVRVQSSPMATAEAAARANPLGKIPALIRDDGPTLYDSRVICRYLDAQAGGHLYPQGRIWEILTLEATADGIMDAAVLIRYEQQFRNADDRQEVWVAAQRARIARALDAMSERWMSHLSGPLNICQIAIGSALEYLDFRHPDLGWRDGRGELAAWQARFAERPSMQQTRPEG